jgi:hypothetical protein
MLRRLVMERLREALLPALRKTWKSDIDGSVRDLRQQVADLRQQVGTLETQLEQARRASRRLEVLNEWNASPTRSAAALDARLADPAVAAHVRDAATHAQVCSEPTAHVVVEDLLPADVYAALLESIPPPEFFPDRDPVKQDLEMSALGSTPAITQRAWRYFDETLVREVLAPALFERLRPAVVAHYAQSGGEGFGERAARITHETVAGRIMLRRPGYRLAPHLDPRRVVITGLVYFARPGDSEAYGTQLFRVDRPFVASGMKTFFPEEEGMTCEVARVVPFRANTLLAFVNSRAAHGASLPRDATLRERYSYQFYLKPRDGELKALLRELPPEQQAGWGRYLEKK